MSGSWDAGLVAALDSPLGRRVRATAAAALHGAAGRAAAGDAAARDPLALATAVRRAHPEADTALVSAALTAARLSQDAAARLGPAAYDLLLTPAGAQQASRPEVAAYRASRLAAAGRMAVADLGCGVGSDALAFAAAGLDVVAVEADPGTAAVAAVNLRRAAPGAARVVTGDVTDPAVLDGVLAEVDTAFVDPARRDPGGAATDRGGRARAERDPERWSPPWRWVLELAGRQPSTVAKVAPGIDRALAPAGAETSWTSVDGRLVEASVWFHGVAETGVRRRAVVLPAGEQLRSPSDSDTEPAAVGPVGAYLLEPDDAVIRAGLVADLASLAGGRLLDPAVAFVTAEAPLHSALARTYAVLDLLPDDVRGLRRALRERGFGDVVVKTRGVAVTPEDLRRHLRLGGDWPTATVVVTRTPTGGIALLVERVRNAPAAAPHA